MHKASVVACVMITVSDGTVHSEVKTFGTMTRDLLELGDWLKAQQLTHAAMESTGSYWKPVYNLLEGQIELLVVNAHHIKAVPGRKTDVKDAEWIADLLRHGLLRGSFIPAKPQRELRELVRHRSNLVGRRAHTGVSATEMLQAILAGQTQPEVLAEMARGRMQRKKELLHKALEGRVEEHHRLMLSQLLVDIANYDDQVNEVGALIAKRLEGQQELLDRLDQIPGVNRRVAEVIVAEVGTDVKRFQSAAKLASWAGICPGNNQSAGKRRSSHIRPGNRSLRAALVEAANAAGKKKDCYLATMYHRLAGKRGKKRALIAVARTILQSIYYMIQRGLAYQDLGADYYDRRDPEGLARRLARRIEKLGFAITLEPLAKVA